MTIAKNLQTNRDNNINSEYNSLRRGSQYDQNISFGKFDEKTYANVYETQKGCVKRVTSIDCVEHGPTEEFQDYCNSRLLYDTLCKKETKNKKQEIEVVSI